MDVVLLVEKEVASKVEQLTAVNRQLLDRVKAYEADAQESVRVREAKLGQLAEDNLRLTNRVEAYEADALEALEVRKAKVDASPLMQEADKILAEAESFFKASEGTKANTLESATALPETAPTGEEVSTGDTAPALAPEPGSRLP